MKTTTKTWGRALVASVALCAAGAWATENYLDQNGGTKNYGSETQINKTASSQRLILWQGTANINTGASFITGGDSGGACNFVGVDRGSSAIMNINGGTVWCTTSGGGAGTLGVGNNNYGVTSYLTLNSGILKVDGVLRSAVAYNDGGGATSSGTITINGGEATVGTVYIGASSVNTGTSTLVLNGGKLKTGNITFRKGNGQVFTWTNGTLVATKANIFNVQAFDASNTKTRTMEITGNPAIFNTAGYAQSIPAFTGTGKLRLTGGGAVAFSQSTLTYGLVLDGAVVNLGTLEANAVPITAKSLEIAGPVTLNVSFSASPSGRYPLIACTDSLDGSLDQITVVGSSGELVREGNTLYLSVEDVGGIDDCLFRYDFTSGGKVYSHIGHPTEPVSEWSGFTAVNGPGGHATAVHPCGVGTITDGENVLNNGDWTIAMCVKPGTVERGVLLSIGSGRCQQNSRDICFLSSSTPGRLRISSRQTWGSQNYNEPGGASMEVTGIGDTATSFHTIVATCTAYKNDTDGATMTIYVDGALKGSFDVDHTMTQQFKSTFCFGGPFEVVSGRTGWGSNTPFYDTSSNMDVAFRDVRFFTRILDADEAAAYAAAFPVAAAATNSIADCNFRHNFTSGKLAVEGNGYTDGATPMANTGTAVDDPYGFGTATFPDKAGYGSVNVGLDRDWTCAMTLRPGTVASNYGILCCLGGVTSKGIGVVVASTPNNGELRFAIPQNYNGGSGRNWTGNYITLTGLGDTVNEFHSLVLIHGRNQKANNANNANKSWSSGVISIYWDGEWKGALSTSDPAASNERPFLNWIRYGSIWNTVPANSGVGTYNELTDSSCGAAFRDLRFTTNVWTSVEAHAYTKSMSPLKDYLFRYDFETGVKSYSHNGCATEPAGEWSGYTAVNGPAGYGTAVHACGTGTITDGNTKLNEDWTLAMSVKPCDVEKGVILCLGKCDSVGKKQLAICSSSTPGKIHIAAIQRWTGGSDGVNVPLTLNPTGLGDTTNAFHTLVAVHEASKGTKKFSDRQETGLITFYWDGTSIGTIDTGTNGGERLFENGFRFSALRTALSGYADLTGNPDAAFRDVRFFTRALPASEIALYASQYPAATAAVCDLDGYHFRHNFATGKLAVEGDGFTDTSLAGTGTKVFGAIDGHGYAAFPDKAGVGTVSGGLNRDWTLAMSVKAPVVESGKNGIMLTLGGVETNQKKALTICSTADSTGGLFIAVPQRYGSAESSINTCQARISLSGLGDITNKYHSLVIVHARNQKNDSNAWQTGTYGIYWDGKYVNAIVNTDSRGLQFMDNLRYGAIYNRSLGGDGSTLQPFYVEPDAASGLAFQDVRLYTKALSSAEARAYAAEYPVSEPGVDAAYAWWTGGGDPANLNDPENWACTNSAGDVVEGALPIASTVVVLNGNNTFAIPAGSTPVWTTTQVGYGGAVALGADCDWSAFPNLTIAEGSYIDLKGHDLKVSYITAAGEGAYVTNSVVSDALPKLWAEDKFVEGDYIDTAKVAVYTDNLEVKAVNSGTLTATSLDLASVFDAGISVTSGVTTVNGNAYPGQNGHAASISVSGNGGLRFQGYSHFRAGYLGDSSVSISVSDNATFSTSGYMTLGHHNSGTTLFTQNGGTVTIPGGFNVGVGNTSTSRYEMVSGTLTVSGSLVPGHGETTGGHGVFEQSGGTVNANSYFTIGYTLTSEGSYVMSGGTLNVPNQPVYVGQSNSAKGLLEVSGGNATATKGVWLGVSSSSASGTLRLKDSGRLTAPFVKRDSGAATVEFDGGTLAATGDNASFVSGIANVVFKAGGVTLDTAGHAVAFANCTLKATPGATAITLTGGGTLDFTNTTLNFTEPLNGSFVLAKVSDGNAATFTGVPALADGVSGYKVIRSADGKNIKVVRRGCMLLVE